MSNNMIIKMNQTPFMQAQGKSAIGNNKIPYLKVPGFEKQKKEQAVIVDISNEGRLKLKNSWSAPDAMRATGRGGYWDTEKGVRFVPNVGETMDYFEAMRIDEPETYAKFMELLDKAYAGEAAGVDWHWHGEAAGVISDWVMRKCIPGDGRVHNPAAGKMSVLADLEEIHSADGEDTSFNCYGPEKAERRNSLWRFSARFNVLISTDMLTNLFKWQNSDNLSDIDKEEKSDLLLKISDSVMNMKDAARQYKGDLEALRFGVKLWDNGDVTYHANYKNCENEDGIMAGSAQELLEMLMKKE